MEENRQMSQSILLGMLLAFAGGMLDAYTYLCRGQVFATAETGNLVLLGLNLAQGEWQKVLYYLFPVLAFAIGVLAAEGLTGLDTYLGLHWRQWVLMIECALLIIVAFIPGTHDPAANMLVSFISAVQVQTFRKFNGLSAATTMCTGNLRSGTEMLFKRFCRNGKKGAHLYYLLIACFIMGAVVSGIITNTLKYRAVIVACIPLAAGFGLMFIKNKKGRSY